MASLVLMVPGRLSTRTGGYGYDRRIVAGLRDRGWSVTVRELDASFPLPDAAARAAASRELADVPDGATVLVDGLALGAMPDEVHREAARLRIVALVHHPLAAETGLDVDTAAHLDASERRALEAARLVVVTSGATAAMMAHYGVGAERIAVVEPGVDRAEVSRAPDAGPLQVLCVAAVVPRKGHDLLVRSLAAVRDRDWRATFVGSVERDPGTAERIRASIVHGGLGEHVRLVGEVDAAQLEGCYQRAHLFVCPTIFEGYGMAVAEALAHGLPVIATATGAIPQLVGDDAGIVVPPGDGDALSAALTQVLDDRRVLDRLALGARRVRERLPDWNHAAASMARLLERVAQS